MRDRDYTASSDFLKRLFGETLHNVELRACPNVRGEGRPETFASRNEHEWQAFARRYDADGMGTYFGVCTREGGGKAEHVQECPALWVDIDCAKQGIRGAAARDALNGLPFPPSVIVNSGGGLHAYWVFEEPVAVALGENSRSSVQWALKQLVRILAGDQTVAELARIMRLPGTFNSKAATLELNDGEPALCEVEADDGRVYDFEMLCEWLEHQTPRLTVALAASKPVREDDPFTKYAREAGYEPAIDIDAELAAMRQGGSGTTSIHQTQLRVSMSMISRGYEDDDIVERILAATSQAASSDKWNWSQEERDLRKMILTGRSKAVSRDQDRRSAGATPLHVVGNAALAQDAERVLAKRKIGPKKSEKDGSTTVAIGEAAIGVWRDRHGPVMHTDGTTYAYEQGVWVEWDDRLAQRLRAIIQEGCARLGVEPKTAILGAAKAYFMDRPELAVEDVAWDAHGLIVGDDGTLDPATGLVGEHSPEHFARYKVGAPLQGARSCSAWLAFLVETFSDKETDEAQKIIASLQEWFGAMLVIEKPRATRMGLLAHGASRTGKTQIAQVGRGLLGARHVSGAKMRDLEGRFGMEPFLGKRGWIADDAIGEGEYLDADTYKVIVTGEPISVQCKGGRNVETAFGFPVMLTANNLPRVKDQSDAVYNRSLILPCTKVRAETAPEPVGYNSISEKIVAEELTGVLWWAFEGWQRLSARGYFTPPATMLDARKGFEADNNPVATWMTECTVRNPEIKVSRADLLASMNGWWSQEYGVDAKPWSGRGFFPRLTKGIAGYSKEKDETTDAEGVRYVVGIELIKTGLLAWRIHKDSRWGESAKTSTEEAFVNRDHRFVAPSLPADRRPRF